MVIILILLILLLGLSFLIQGMFVKYFLDYWLVELFFTFFLNYVLFIIEFF